MKSVEEFLKTSSKRVLILLALFFGGILGIFYFGFKDTGDIYYDGFYYSAGSFFMPDEYVSYSLYTSASDLNKECPVVK